MNENQQAAFVMAAVARALIRAQSMTAENMEHEHHGEPMSYLEDSFLNIIEEEGIGHNQVLTSLGR